jgi:adenine-specific DNA methylase
MKVISIELIFDRILKKQDTCTAFDINKAVDEYCKKHPDTYIERDRDTINWLMENSKDKYYDDYVNNIFRKQEIVICPCCGTKFRKFPDIKQFNKVKKYVRKSKSSTR